MSENQNEKHCFNCNHPLKETIKYCPECGQKDTNGKISFRQVVADFAKDYMHWDSKLPISIWYLLSSPGKLTNEYFAGKHKSYLKPSRLFGTFTILFFALILFKYSDRVTNEIEISFNQRDLLIKAEQDSIYRVLDTALMEVKLEIDDRRVNNLLDTAFLPFQPDNKPDSSNITIVDFGQDNNFKLKIAHRDLVYLKPKEVVEKYEIEGRFKKMVAAQTIKTIQEGSSLLTYIISRMSFMFFAMVPVFAFLLKLIYIRRKRFYVEHLIFAFHIHAFLFLTYSIYLLFIDVIPKWGFPMLLICQVIYLFLSLRRVYQQGKGKSLFKFLLLIAAYFMIFMIFMLLTAFIGFMVY